MEKKEIFEAIEKEFEEIPAGPPYPADVDERIKFEKAGTFLVIKKVNYENIKRKYLGGKHE